MRKNILCLLAAMFCVIYPLQTATADTSPEISQQVTELMRKMTLKEKVGQMCQYIGAYQLAEWDDYYKQTFDLGDNVSDYKSVGVPEVEALILEGLIGSFLLVDGPEEANYLQKLAAQSRLSIPLLIATDAIHGHAMYPHGATVFPSPITLSCAFDPDMTETIGAVTAKEMRATGYHWTFSPNVDVARDPRWGRVGETFGEDEFLVAELGAALVRGYQGDDFSTHVIACAKHFAAGGDPSNGLNFSPMDVSERRMRELFLPPFKKALDAGCKTVMAAHNEINGIPCHANRWLLTDILRGEWGFDGFVISDWTDVHRLHNLHHIAHDIQQADILAVNAGIDMHMHGPDFLEPVYAAVQEGLIPEERIDDACRTILTAKFELGLFDDPYVDTEKAEAVVQHPKHKELALKAARKSIVLLQNRNNLLPFKKDIGTVFITGPNANRQTLIGDWARPLDEEDIITVYEGLQKVTDSNINFYDCGHIREIDDSDLAESAQRASRADIAVVVVGSHSLRHEPDHRTCGENVARTDIDLAGRQLDLIRAIHSTGTPTVVILVNGRPLAEPWMVKNIPAIVEAWEPGMMGGQAIAEMLVGDVNPSGKLSITIPRSVGHIHQNYDYKPSAYFRDYVFADKTPLFEFGYGLSYTSFEYSDLQIPESINLADNVPVSVTVKNSGDRAGDEIVLVFINDLISSVTTPVKKLAAFQRITLQPGEQKKVELTIDNDRLQLLDMALNPVVEPGEFEIMVDELKNIFTVKK